MPVKNKETIYRLTSIAASVVLIVSGVILVSYLMAPFLGGKLFLNAIFKCASWSGIAFAIKIAMKRATKGLRIRTREYLLFCIAFVFNIVVWFPYPASLFLSLLGVLGFVISYKYQNREETE
jgi:hypothetical protein